MIRLVQYFESTGEIVGACSMLESEIPDSWEIAGRKLLAHSTANGSTHGVVEGEVIAYGEDGIINYQKGLQPGYRWSASQEDWIDERELATVAQDLLNTLQGRRDTLLEGGFIWDGSPFHSDAAVSQPRLLGLYTDARNGNFTTGGEWWKLQNGDWRLLSDTDTIAIWLTFKEYMRFLFGVFALHEATVGLLVDDADLEGLRTYDIEWGWTPEIE